MENDLFADAFANALKAFLDEKHISQSEAVRRLGLEVAKGKARLNKYCNDSSKDKRPTPEGDLLYLLCTKLGFEFVYEGYKIAASTLNGGSQKTTEKTTEQLLLKFDGLLDLTDSAGTCTVAVKRPQGRIEVAISLRGASRKK